MDFSLNTALDVEAISDSFRTDGYVSIPGILAAGDADRVFEALRTFKSWNLVFSDRGKHVDLSPIQLQAMPQESAKQLQAAVYAQASNDFQYLYHNYPIYDAHQQGRNVGHVLHRFYEWLGGDTFLGFARKVTGFDDISFVDSQATRYGPGHFLTVHDDSQEGKQRRAAYVFNFTRGWRPDWGGYLQLLDANGHIRRGLLPAFNTLNLVAVPQPHNVGFVTPFAGSTRLSITGWLRYGKDSASS